MYNTKSFFTHKSQSQVVPTIYFIWNGRVLQSVFVSLSFVIVVERCFPDAIHITLSRCKGLLLLFLILQFGKWSPMLTRTKQQDDKVKKAAPL